MEAQTNGHGRQSDFSHPGSSVSFKDIKYSVMVSGGKCCGKKSQKHILKGVSGMFQVGCMNAILGATGSGKTSLLDVLANRKDPRWLQGTILIDGKPQPSNFKCLSGYVVQDDVVMGTLTVKENLMFSANLRLPESLGKAEKAKRVEDCIEELGLAHVANSKIGNEFIRGVSGGERKRTNIGMELVTAPTVLFLDEPTTGLDSSTANAVMSLLHKLSRTGRTIIFSIHQPRYSIFKLFDNMALLSRGHMVFHGPAAEAIGHFESLGYVCEAHNNPADFFLDIINGDSSALKTMPAIEKMEIQEGEIEHGVKVMVEVDEDDKSSDKIAVALMKKYKESRLYQIVEEELANEKPVEKMKIRDTFYATSFMTQLIEVSKRTMKNVARNPALSLVQTFIMMVFGLLVGLIYRDVTSYIVSGSINRFGAFFFVIMTQVFSNGTALEAFIRERVFFIHENSNGFYRVSAYFLAKVFCDIVPLRLLPVTAFSIIVYFLIGFRTEPGPFFFFWLTLLVVNITAACIGFLFGSVCRLFATAQVFIILIYVTTMIFAGFLVQLVTVDWYLRWIQYLSIFRYGLNALSINEFSGITMCLHEINATTTECLQPVPGTSFLDSRSIPYGSYWDMWVNIVALLIICFFMLIIAYIALRKMNKYK